MIDLGIVKPGSTIRIPFSSFDKDDGSSITMTNFAVGDILIYKNGSTTERASTTGFTATTDFDGKTGKHLAIIDLADNTTADFFNAGAEYLVAIDAVTVDAVTTGGWIARFTIGYVDADINTTIATLSSQTSFTLTAGPAEDDAINGCVVLIHDIASAVQLGYAAVADYTGSTKTVTLTAGVTFTAAAGDNISIFGPSNARWFAALLAAKLPLAPATAGRDLVVDAAGLADANTVKLGPSGSGTAQTAKDVGGAVPAAAAGASGGLLISGANSGTTTLAALTVTGSFTISDGLLISRSSANTSAITATGNGTGHGVAFTSGGGATGNGITLLSAATNGHGLKSTGAGTGDGAELTAGASGADLDADIAGALVGNITGNLSGSVGSVTGAVGSVTGNVGGNVVGSTASVAGAVGSVTGNVGGNVTGSVGSVAAGGITATSFGASAINAAALAADAGAEIADAILDRDMSTGTDSGSTTVRTPRQALRAVRNKVSIAAGTATVCKEDDATASWTAAVTTTAGNPISAIDPAGP